jgi:hypothetical protein
MVTGVTFTVPEVLTYKEIEDEYQAGYNLDCGFFSCWKVPRYKTRITRVPVFKRRIMSLDKQKELHNWMIQQAIESAEHLVSIIGSASSDDSPRDLPDGDHGSRWKWESPQYELESPQYEL